jgi:mRNA interferase MazF
VVNYVPDASDLVWLSLDPQVGREQAGRRPFLVLSPRIYNAKSSLVVGCPISSRIKGYGFEVPVSAGRVKGVVLADHVKSLDWRERNATFIERASTETHAAARALIGVLLEIVR